MLRQLRDARARVCLGGVPRKLDFENETRLGFVQDLQSQRGDAAVALEVQFVDAGEVEVGQFDSGSEYSPVGDMYTGVDLPMVNYLHYINLFLQFIQGIHVRPKLPANAYVCNQNRLLQSWR